MIQRSPESAPSRLVAAEEVPLLVACGVNASAGHVREKQLAWLYSATSFGVKNSPINTLLHLALGTIIFGPLLEQNAPRLVSPIRPARGFLLEMRSSFVEVSQRFTAWPRTRESV
jgi:hypothetical protein